MTTLLLIRHGETDWNVAGRWQGHTDIPLNENGVCQANALARRLSPETANWPFDALYSSDLQRAAHTATLIGAAVGMTPRFDAAWREWFLGEFEGYTTQELRAQFPEQFAELRAGDFRPKNGESQHLFRQRIENAYTSVVQQHPGETVAIVSHGGAIGTLLSTLFGVPRNRFSLNGNTGITRIEINPNGPRLTLLNDTAHLENGWYTDHGLGHGGVS